ncbi:MAG: hypothetical protein ABEJ72_00900 [Candidatus Aenigmatarchaeota archaeon]
MKPSGWKVQKVGVDKVRGLKRGRNDKAEDVFAKVDHAAGKRVKDERSEAKQRLNDKEKEYRKMEQALSRNAKEVGEARKDLNSTEASLNEVLETYQRAIQEHSRRSND